MNDALLHQAANWLDAGESVAMATIIRIHGSSSQPLGARMIITRDNRFVGAVSGGCVENDVYQVAQAVLDGGRPLMLHYHRVENPLIEIGLNCDGQIEVLVERLTHDYHALLAQPGSHVRVTICSLQPPDTPAPVHAILQPDGIGSAELAPAITADALATLKREHPLTVSYDDGRVALFEPILLPPTLLIFGAEPIAVPLARLAKIMGFRTVVSDARPAFVTHEKYPGADQVLAAWPQNVIDQVGIDARTYVVSLNHEPRFEDALLHALAGHELRYLGAIGKRQRHTERLERAQQAKFDIHQLPPIHTPIGLDIGGKSPEEVALSVMAEIIAVRNDRSGGMLVYALT